MLVMIMLQQLTIKSNNYRINRITHIIYSITEFSARQTHSHPQMVAATSTFIHKRFSSKIPLKLLLTCGNFSSLVNFYLYLYS